MRFFLVDKIKELIPGKTAVGVKCWRWDNEIFQDHFPGFPTTPGVLLTESMAQLAGILIEKSYVKEFNMDEKVYPILSIIQKAKFRTFVSPGDQCILEAEMKSVDRGRATAFVTTKVDGKLVCEATLSFMVSHEKDLKDNPYIHKREQYVHSIMPADWKDESNG
jgi:3-hydroxyacyl-[acyl-carrier-protein] dehydratase